MSDEFDPRRIAVEQRLFNFGVISWSFTQAATTEQLEQLADRLEATYPTADDRSY